MSKARSGAYGFQGRTASYSCYGYANGRVEVLPKHAKDVDYRTEEEQLKDLNRQERISLNTEQCAEYTRIVRDYASRHGIRRCDAAAVIRGRDMNQYARRRAA